MLEHKVRVYVGRSCNLTFKNIQHNWTYQHTTCCSITAQRHRILYQLQSNHSMLREVLLVNHHSTNFNLRSKFNWEVRSGSLKHDEDDNEHATTQIKTRDDNEHAKMSTTTMITTTISTMTMTSAMTMSTMTMSTMTMSTTTNSTMKMSTMTNSKMTNSTINGDEHNGGSRRAKDLPAYHA